MRILIVRLSSIGDCVLASPVLEALRERYPDAHIAWAVQEKSAPVVRGLPGLSEVMLWRPRRGSYWNSLPSMLWRVRRRHFDIVVDLQGIDKAGLVSLASGAKRRISGSSARRIARWSSTECVDESKDLHARLFHLHRAMPLDIAPDAADRYFPRVPLTAEHHYFAAQFLRESGVTNNHRLIGLNLGASGPKKRWPAARFARLARRILAEDPHTRIVVFGAAADHFLWQEFLEELEHIQPVNLAHIVNGVGNLNLLQMAAVAEHCSAFVTADTGPMHIAAAVGAPVLAICGPADVHRTGPVRKPGAAPIQVLDAREITGSWPAPMSVWSVDRVYREVCQLADEAEAHRQHFKEWQCCTNEKSSL